MAEFAPVPMDPNAGPRRFVVLRHDLPDGGRHFDFMLAQGESLATWQCPRPPEDATAEPMGVRRITDHRCVYLDYEGPISGNRGEVARHDVGHYQVLCWSETEIVVRLSGGRLAGIVRLTRQADDPQSWSLALSAK